MARDNAAPMDPDDQTSGVVGNVARGSKAASEPGHELMDFAVRKGDNGGVVVSETYKPKLPAGRRPGAGFLMLGKTKENPFSAKDGSAAVDHVTGLMAQMGAKPAPPPPPPDEEDEDEDQDQAAPDEDEEAAPPPMPAPAAGPPIGGGGLGGPGGPGQMPGM